MAHTQSSIAGSNIEFKRTGGRFISYRNAVLLVIIFFCILLVAFFLGRFSTGSASDTTDEAPLSLPSIDPLHYNLMLTILNNIRADSTQFTFSGQVDITLRIREDTKYIKLNSRKLNILLQHSLLKRVTGKNETLHFETMTEAELLQNIETWENNSTDKIEIEKQQMKEHKEEFSIHTTEALDAGSVYLLSLQFEGKIEEDAIGLYRTKYVGHDNTMRWIIATQMEPNNARQVFPCFDELDHKALFSVTISHPQEYKAFSNMGIQETHEYDETGFQVSEFNTSPRLPPNLLSIILTNNFKTQSPDDRENIWTQPELVEETDRATVLIPKLFAYFQTFLNNNLPLNKIDFVGIPDYSAKGSESFGLIAIEENELLYSAKNSSLEQFEKVSLHVAFHIVQQWFNNMVTPQSWSMLWFREAFAKYLSYHGINEVGGQDHFSDRFLVNEMQKTLFADSLEDAQPLHQMNFKKPVDIQLLNQQTVYSKGGCLIRMLYHFIGDINFKHGLQEYIKKWYLKNVNPSDAWECFDDSVKHLKMYDFNVSIREVMQSWVDNKGYPFVTVNLNRETMVATFTQVPFGLNSDNNFHGWFIPISYTTKEENNFNSTKPKLLLGPQGPVTVTLNKNESVNTWIIANIQQTGYFRVNYDSNTWEILLLHLESNYSSIPVSSRFQLLDDGFALAQGGHIPFNIPLKLSSLMGKYEQDLIPWQGLLKYIDFMRGILADENSLKIYKQYVVKLLKRPFEELINKEPNMRAEENQYLLYLVSSLMCRQGYEGCIQWANKHFQESLKPGEHNHKSIHGSLRGSMYSVVAQKGGSAEWLGFLNKIKDPTVDSFEKYYLAEGLASTQNETAIQELLLEISKHNDSVVHKSLKVEIWVQLGQHMQNLDRFLVFLRQNWEQLYLKLQHNKDLLHKLVQGAGQQLHTAGHRRSVQELENYHFTICAQEDKFLFDHIMKEISLKISLQDSYSQEILAWMNNYITKST